MSGTNTTGGRSKAETAELIALWATHELGFRKASTLVTAKGDEKLAPSDIEPLQQGELANFLELSATHLVSSQRANQVRQMLAAYCSTQPAPSTSTRDQPKAFIALYNDLKSASAKEQKVVSEIQGMELENLGCIQAIDELEVKRSATESRIRELRLQILVKQEMAEKVRRLSKRMRILIREMAVASGDSSETSADHLYELIRKAQYSLANEGAGSSS
ncbi:hypothetical protein GGF37_004179, partial [Kickxella alabastrina]